MANDSGSPVNANTDREYSASSTSAPGAGSSSAELVKSEQLDLNPGNNANGAISSAAGVAERSSPSDNNPAAVSAAAAVQGHEFAAGMHHQGQRYAAAEQQLDYSAYGSGNGYGQYYASANSAAGTPSGGGGAYLNQLMAASFPYPHLYSSAAASSLHGLNGPAEAGLEEYSQQLATADSSEQLSQQQQHHLQYSALEGADESQTGPIRGGYSARSEHGGHVWRPY